MHTTYGQGRTERGSMLIVALLLSAIIGVSLVSYLQLSRTALTISNRAVYNNAAINLAEQGIEEAMYGINQLVADSAYAWPGWTRSGANAYREWTASGLSQNAQATYRVYVYNYAGIIAPKIVSRARVTLNDNSGAPIEKWIEVQLNKTSKFANGLVAKDSIEFHGNNATVDSWNSEKDSAGVARATPVPFSAGVRNDNGSVGSISVATDAVVVQNADVWGYVSTGGTNPATFVGSTGSILGASSPGGSNVDPSRVSTNFSASFEAVAVPTTVGITIGAIGATDKILPDPIDVGAGRGVVGTDGHTYYFYDAPSVRCIGTSLTITARVVLRVTTGGQFTIGGGSGEVALGATGQLAVYADGPISIGGQGISNGVDVGAPPGITQDELGQASRFQLWGTKTNGTQNISISGNGLFSGVIYAPQGDVSIVGNGAICGSVVANNIDLSGNAKFHYDEALGDFGGGNPFRVTRWKELTTAADRASYAAIINW